MFGLVYGNGNMIPVALLYFPPLIFFSQFELKTAPCPIKEDLMLKNAHQNAHIGAGAEVRELGSRDLP